MEGFATYSAYIDSKVSRFKAFSIFKALSVFEALSRFSAFEGVF